jgi:hypothetical protein
MRTLTFSSSGGKCCNPILEEWEDDSLIPKMGTWEFARTSETSEFDCKGQNTSHRGVLYIIGKLVTLSSPIPELQHAPLPLLVLKARSVPRIPHNSTIWVTWTHLGLTRNLGARHIQVRNLCWSTTFLFLSIWTFLHCYLVVYVVRRCPWNSTFVHSQNSHQSNCICLATWPMHYNESIHMLNLLLFEGIGLNSLCMQRFTLWG